MSLVHLLGDSSTTEQQEHRQAHQCVAAECGQTSIPLPGWRCRHCGNCMRYGFQRANCPGCGQRCLWLRRGDRWDYRCNCDETPEQRGYRLREEAYRARREAKEDEEDSRRDQLKRARAMQADGLEKAANCWENEKKRRCGVSRSDLHNPPRPFCRFCPKFVERGP